MKAVRFGLPSSLHTSYFALVEFILWQWDAYEESITD